MLGIEFPIIQGGMLWVSRAELVAAVSNAGGLGVLSSWTFSTAAELRNEIQRTKTLTNKPFGVNLPIAPALRPLDVDGVIDAIIAEGVKVVESAGRVTEQLVDRLKKAGVRVIHKCTAIRFARTAERMGCDAIIIDGYECGGHPGEEDITSLVLIPLTRDAVNVPVIAAGGFADGRGLVAALALGAEAVLMGTRFMATKESPIHDKVKQWFIRCSERDTILVQRSLRNSARVLKNTVAQKVIEIEKQGSQLEEVAPLILGTGEKEVFETGDVGKGLVHCGQCVGLVRNIPTVKKVIDHIVHDADEIVIRLGASKAFQPLKCE